MFALPIEANAILIIDPNAVLAPPITSQALKTIAWGRCRLSQLAHSIDLIELAASHSPEPAWALPLGQAH